MQLRKMTCANQVSNSLPFSLRREGKLETLMGSEYTVHRKRVFGDKLEDLPHFVGEMFRLNSG